MEKINQTLKRLASNEGFQKRYEDMKRQVLQHPDVKAFLEEHREGMNKEIMEKSMIKFFEYVNQNKECSRCPGLENCVNMMKGYRPKLTMSGTSVDLQYERCEKKRMDDERHRNERLIKSLHVPKDILKASFEELEQDTSRFDAVKKAALFVKNYEVDSRQKGIYFYGKFGVGKSFLLGAIANELAKKQIISMIVYVPELFREMKSSIADSTLNEKIEALKKEPILMLDDIGAEALSSWTRDEILGPLLQFRMLENLPTFFTSNFDFQGLEHHLTYNQRGEEERLKARRIMERIRYLSDPVLVDGPNRRDR